MIGLYTNAFGKVVTQTSYSQRESFRFCPRQYELRYVHGWKGKEQKASKYFGKALEAAIQFFEENGRIFGTGPEIFEAQWERVKLIKEFNKLTYSNSEGSWETLLRTGREMMLLYEIYVPSLPISPKRLQFQVPVQKQIFPHSELSVITNKAYIDILSFPAWNHPMLAPIEGPVETRPLIIDCKTASADLDTNLIRLDPQLAEYAWQLQIFDVAFLWFVKRSHELKKGDKVTLLQSVGSTPAGTNGYVLNIDKKENKVLVGDSKVKAQFEDGKRFFQRSDVLICEPTALTKQRLQFSSVRLTDTEVREVGQRIGFDTVQMVESHRTGFYPKLGGIRFPNQKCNFCEMRGICLDQPDLRDALLTRAGEEWLDGDED